MNSELSTGDLARACGVSPDTIRFYERRGAISARRLAAGYRRFPPETVQRVHVIRRAIAIGFSMEEIVRFFTQRRAGRPPCEQVRAAAQAKLTDIDRRIEEMVALREKLTAILADWDIRLADRSEGEPAHLLESLERSSS
jgi:DNA-binding transcriptional MerR regulator